MWRLIFIMCPYLSKEHWTGQQQLVYVCMYVWEGWIEIMRVGFCVLKGGKPCLFCRVGSRLARRRIIRFRVPIDFVLWGKNIDSGRRHLPTSIPYQSDHVTRMSYFLLRIQFPYALIQSSWRQANRPYSIHSMHATGGYTLSSWEHCFAWGSGKNDQNL